jgi:preprotein translocase subunit SecG
MQTMLLVAELIIAVALICFVLLQRSEGGALGMGGGGGGMGGLFTARGAADTLTRTTAILAFLFFMTCIGLNLLELHGRDESGASILDSAPASPIATAPAKPSLPAPLPVGPSVPKPQ